ncbi:hypothetical protein N7G274_010576 [Stereocaulon virgatum]|uniref:Uncharacterized protein n=1 Tax=Stereocaulon virgatum TaxID=373712 RepID=A0ABR3ZTB7_9LECA
MATLLVLILATVASNTINASPLPTVSSTPAPTQTGLLPVYAGISTPSRSPVLAATGVPHAHKGDNSPFPAFDASQYPRHNFTGHHGNNIHHHCEHGNRTVDRIIKDLNDIRHRKNATHHVNGTHCRNDTDSHQPVSSGHAKLAFPNGDHQKIGEARCLQEKGYPFLELTGRDIDTEAVPNYVSILEKNASSSSSPSMTVKAEKVKRDTINSGEGYLASVAYSKPVIQRDVNAKHTPASVQYMGSIHKHAPPSRDQDEHIPASIKYMEYYKKHAPTDRTEFAKRGEEDNDGLTSWAFLSL